MSKRAEDAALKAYPVVNTWSPFGPLPVDQNEVARDRYRQGYEQAEKDTIERATEWLCTHHNFDTQEQAGLYAECFRKAMED